MLNPVVNPAFRKHCFALIFVSCAFTIFTHAQPVPQITGDTAVCQGDEYFYSTPYNAGNTYSWVVSPGGVVSQNLNNAIGVVWMGPQNSTQSVSVTESDPMGGGGTDQITVYIKNSVLACENNVNVSLDQAGIAVITPDMLLDGTYNTYAGFQVSVTTPNGAFLGDTLNCSHIGLNLTGKVMDLCSGNSCWSQIKLEDKKAPLFDCPADTVEIPCDTEIDSFPHPDVVDNCDPDPAVNLIGFQVDNSDVCNGILVTKNWIAVDNYGNESNCTQLLFINPDALVDFPEDRFWSCDTFNLYPNIIEPTPFTNDLATTGSGVPTGATGPYCQYSYVFNDDTLDACGNTFKIIRTWTVINWCTGQIILSDADGDDNEQVIKIVDEKNPAMSVPPITLNANITGSLPVFCASTGFLPAPVVSDECNDVTVRIFTSVGEAVYANGVDGKNGGHVPQPGLTIGTHTIIYRATDECGNETELLVNATVTDQTAPTVICDEITDVNLDIFGFTTVFAETFDDGSHDNCCIDYMHVKHYGDPDWTFAPSIDFDCSQDTAMVVLRVYDCFGNYNECMVIALVKDKIAPVCVAPPQKVIPCTDLPPDITEDFVHSFGEPSVYDNCGATVIELPWAENINACGEGHIIRFFMAVDSSGNVSANCEQHIYVVPDSDWLLQFPENWYGACGDTVDAPDLQVSNFGCDMFAVSYEDQYFALGNDSACFKIIRTWKVINWCGYDPYLDPILVDNHPLGVDVDETTYNNFGQYHYQQHLVIHDDTPPALSYPFSNVFCSEDADCAAGDVFLPLQIDGECSNDFTIVYHLDLNNDLTYEMQGTGFFEGPLPIGDHRILYLVEDGCSNDSEIEVEFTVKDCKKPTPVCENGLIVEIMQTGMIEICAGAFDYGSYDNCPGPLTLSFSADTADSCRTYFCTDTYFQLNVQLWVTDAAGNQDYCETFLTIQDNMFSCDTGIPITGQLTTEDDEPLQAASVQLNGSMGNLNFTTTETGTYEFADLETGEDYTITPVKDTEPLNGVTTLDLVQISRHILGMQPLGSPYKMIAADANKSQSITTFDLVEIRKMILFINTSFSNNTSWRFVPKSYVFPNPANPWEEVFPEIINLNNLPAAVDDADFVAIKTGDVNNSAAANGNFTGSGTGDRSTGMLIFAADALAPDPGTVVPVTLRAKDFNAVQGFQFTLDFDPEALEFQSVVPTGVTAAENFGLNLLAQGAVTVSWYDADLVTLADGDAVITLEFKVKQACELQNVLGISSRFTAAEAYIGAEAAVWEVGVEFSGVTASQETGPESFELYQNIPNPFSQKTIIGFKLPQAANVTLTVYDAAGRTLRSIEGKFQNGYNEIQLNRQELPGEGMLFYRLETPGFSAVRPMTLVKK